MGAQFSLSPSMVSRKLQVYAFTKSYYLKWGKSPSYGEIAEGLGINRSGAKRHVRQLMIDGMIARKAGARRGITFPDLVGKISRADALLVLRAEGILIDEDVLFLDATIPGTNPTLPAIPELVHIPDIEIETGDRNADGAG